MSNHIQNTATADVHSGSPEGDPLAQLLQSFLNSPMVSTKMQISNGGPYLARLAGEDNKGYAADIILGVRHPNGEACVAAYEVVPTAVDNLSLMINRIFAQAHSGDSIPNILDVANALEAGFKACGINARIGGAGGGFWAGVYEKALIPKESVEELARRAQANDGADLAQMMSNFSKAFDKSLTSARLRHEHEDKVAWTR